MLQLESASHNRGLYYVEEQSGKIYHGKIYQMEDGTRTIRYRYYDAAHWLQLEFFETYGEGESAGTVQSGDYSTECRLYDYPWGYVIMNLPRKTWVVVEVCYTSDGAPFSAPRGTGIGQTETAVVDK